ncbi:MAG: YfiR family protein [Verrucomicrobiota bacterium]|jgi:hypothetical protein
MKRAHQPRKSEVTRRFSFGQSRGTAGPCGERAGCFGCGSAPPRSFAAAFSVVCRFTVVLLLAVWPLGRDAAGAETPKILPPEVVKANWLKYFADFTEWPQGAFTNAAAPFVIGILGDDPVIKTARQFFQDEKAKDRKVVVRKCDTATDAERCHLVFISASEKNELNQILNQLKGLSVLTVGDMESFTQRGGIINFTLEKKPRFEISRMAERLAKLKISSQLLDIGKVVADNK